MLEKLTALVDARRYDSWTALAARYAAVEKSKVIDVELCPSEGPVRMGEVVAKVAEVSGNRALVITDVGQNQLMAARYSGFCEKRSFISSGGLGTMGFGLPAAIGAKIAGPDREVCLFVGDGGIQMTMQEFGTLMQENLPVKIVLLNNNWLGNVRQFQELLFGRRYSQTRMVNPDYGLIAQAYGIKYIHVEEREELDAAVRAMFAADGPVLLDVHVLELGMVYPMIPSGKRADEIMLNSEEWFDDGKC